MRTTSIIIATPGALTLPRAGVLLDRQRLQPHRRRGRRARTATRPGASARGRAPRSSAFSTNPPDPRLEPSSPLSSLVQDARLVRIDYSGTTASCTTSATRAASTSSTSRRAARTCPGAKGADHPGPAATTSTSTSTRRSGRAPRPFTAPGANLRVPFTTPSATIIDAPLTRPAPAPHPGHRARHRRHQQRVHHDDLDASTAATLFVLDAEREQVAFAVPRQRRHDRADRLARVWTRVATSASTSAASFNDGEGGLGPALRRRRRDPVRRQPADRRVHQAGQDRRRQSPTSPSRSTADLPPRPRSPAGTSSTWPPVVVGAVGRQPDRRLDAPHALISCACDIAADPGAANRAAVRAPLLTADGHRPARRRRAPRLPAARPDRRGCPERRPDGVHPARPRLPARAPQGAPRGRPHRVRRRAFVRPTCRLGLPLASMRAWPGTDWVRPRWLKADDAFRRWVLDLLRGAGAAALARRARHRAGPSASTAGPATATSRRCWSSSTPRARSRSPDAQDAHGSAT